MTRAHFTRGVARAELPIVLALAPALLFPTPMRLVVLAAVPVVWWSARIDSGRSVPDTPLNVSLFVLLAMVATSLAATFDIGLSLGKVSGVVLGVLLFWAVARWVRSPRRLTQATAAFIGAGVVLAILGLLGTNWGNKLAVLDAITTHLPAAIRGLPGAEAGFSPNAVAGCLVLFVPLQVALFAGPGRRWVARTWRSIGLQAFALLLTTGTLVLTQSRGAWAGLIVSGLVGLAGRRMSTKVIVAAIVAATVITTGPGRVFDLLMGQVSPEVASTVSGRAELWSRAVYGIQDYPFTGMGMNTFRKVMPVAYPSYLTSPHVDVPHAHNQLLQAALDVGIPGLIAYLSIWITSWAMLVHVYRRSHDAVNRAIAAGLGAGLVAQFVFGITDAIPLGAKVGVLFWCTLGLAAALHQVARPSPDHTSSA